jgi:hypothetical protein
MCSCSECRKLDVEPDSYTDRVLNWVNSIAREVRKRYPDKILVTLAYANYKTPPRREKLEPNVVVVKATGLGNYPFFDEMLKYNPEKINRQISELDAWVSFAKDRVQVCEYDGQYYPVLLDNWTERLRFYAKRGIVGINATYGRPTNFRLLWEYVFARLQWNPFQDHFSLAKEFIDFYYGKAAPPIWNYVQLVNDWHKRGSYDRMLWNGFYPQGFYGREFTTKALADFDEAAQRADTGKLRDQILKEEQLFIEDWMSHPPSKTFDTAAKESVRIQLSRLHVLAGNLDMNQTEILRSAYQALLRAYGRDPGILLAMREVIAQNNIQRPLARSANGALRILPEHFLGSGFGPKVYDWKSPPRMASGVYASDNDRNLSSYMEASFILDSATDHDRWVLELEGQDSDSTLVPALIRIAINEKKVFEGSVQLAKNNWSKQRFNIESGILMQGENILSIVNIGKTPLWNMGWLLVSEAHLYRESN